MSLALIVGAFNSIAGAFVCDEMVESTDMTGHPCNFMSDPTRMMLCGQDFRPCFKVSFSLCVHGLHGEGLDTSILFWLIKKNQMKIIIWNKIPI